MAILCWQWNRSGGCNMVSMYGLRDLWTRNKNVVFMGIVFGESIAFDKSFPPFLKGVHGSSNIKGGWSTNGLIQYKAAPYHAHCPLFFDFLFLVEQQKWGRWRGPSRDFRDRKPLSPRQSISQAEPPMTALGQKSVLCLSFPKNSWQRRNSRNSSMPSITQKY